MVDSHQAVQKLYDTYPFPPDPLSDEPPPGYNWRWSWTAAHSFCTGRAPDRQDIRILDAGCGTGSGTDYLVHQNPQAQVTAIDLSPGALEVAKERCQRSGAENVTFAQMTLETAAEQLEGEFEMINCVGVLHHLPDPVAGIRALAKKLAPGGLLHIFVYAELGRWEIQIMQEAIALLQGQKQGDYTDGVQVGREIFKTLPEQNPLVQRERERWAGENQRDECFADMYVHPQETDYNLHTLFELVDASGLEFVGFSNPQFWHLDRLLSDSANLMERGEALSDRDRYRLIELLDPKAVTHYEFFLARSPLARTDWSDEADLLAATAKVYPCLQGWPSQTFFDANFQLVQLTPLEYEILQTCDRAATPPTIKTLLEQTEADINIIQALWSRQLLILGTPQTPS